MNCHFVILRQEGLNNKNKREEEKTLKSQRSISVVLAGYNEEENIDRAMQETYDSISANFEKYELILVDDASKDCTLEKMLKFEKNHNHVKVLPNYVNMNFGASVLRGLCAAHCDYVTYNACDLPLSNTDLVSLVTNMDEKDDVLVLERTDYKTTKWRGVTSEVNKLLLKIFYPKLTKGIPVLNYVQIYKRDIIKNIIPLARSPIFVWPELVFRAKLKGYRVENVPVKCNVENVRKGAFGHPHDIIWGIYEMLRFRIRLWSKNY